MYISLLTELLAAKRLFCSFKLNLSAHLNTACTYCLISCTTELIFHVSCLHASTGDLPFHASSPGLGQHPLYLFSWLLTDHILFCLATHRTYLPVLHFTSPSLTLHLPSSPSPRPPPGLSVGRVSLSFLTTSPTTTTTRRQCVMRSWI